MKPQKTDIPGNPAQNAAILHSLALWEPGGKTVPTTISPTSFGIRLVFSINAYNKQKHSLVGNPNEQKGTQTVAVSN